MVDSAQRKCKYVTGLVSDLKPHDDVPNRSGPEVLDGTRNDFCHQTLAK